MKISRQVGTVSEVLNIFIQDATVSTGAGLANISAPTVLYGWCRNDQVASSTGACSTSTGALGLYFVSTLTQTNSTAMLGWYQFGVPDGVFASGRSAALHLYGAASMAPVPIEIELTKTNNQQYASSTVYSSTNIVASVTTPVGVSTVTIPVGVSSISIPVGVSSGTWLAGVSTVTDKGGYGVSSISIPVSVSSGTWLAGVSTVTDKTGYGVSSVTGLTPSRLDVSVSSIYSAPFTESYRDFTSTGTLAQLLYEVVAHMGNAAISVTTKTIKKVDTSTAAATFQLDSSSAPTSIVRIT